MVDQLPADMASPRRGPGVGTVLGTGLVCFLLGGAAVAYLAWSGVADPLGLVRTQPSGPAVVAASVAPASQASGVEAIARQQGGLDQRVASLEQRLARLDVQAAAVEGHTARAEALLVAFAARRAIERGAPLGYLADQLRVRFGDAKPNSVAAVLSAASNPVTIDKLVARLNTLEPGLQEASGEGGLAWLQQELGELFIVRHESAPSPEPSKRIDRARLFLESGRVDAAIAEVRNLPGAAKAKDWIADAERFARAQAALDLLESSALLDTHVLKDRAGQPVF
jgi:hypothetical protein